MPGELVSIDGRFENGAGVYLVESDRGANKAYNRSPAECSIGLPTE